MKLTVVEDPQRSVTKFKHVQASHIWAFVHGNGELTYEEQNHLNRCDHCEALFKYFRGCVEKESAERIARECPQAA